MFGVVAIPFLAHLRILFKFTWFGSCASPPISLVKFSVFAVIAGYVKLKSLPETGSIILTLRG